MGLRNRGPGDRRLAWTVHTARDGTRRARDRPAASIDGDGADRPRRPADAHAPEAHRRRPRRVVAGVEQLPWRRLTNPFRPLEILSEDQVESDPSGVAADPGRDRLRGPRRPRARRVRGRRRARRPARPARIRLDPAQVEELISTAPREFTLHARNPERNVVFGPGHLVFSAVGGPAFVTDLDRGRRAGNFADFVDYVRRHRRARRHPPGGRRPARADRPAGRDAPPRHVPDVRARARQDLAVPRVRGDAGPGRDGDRRPRPRHRPTTRSRPSPAA